MIFEKKSLQSEEGTKDERFSCSESLKRKWSCVYSNKYELFFDHRGDYLESTQDLRGAFSDTDDYLDQGLVSADRCASRTSSINSWSENLKPSFTQKLKFKSVMEGEQATFECKLVASPAPKIAWFHNNRPIRKDLRKNFKIESAMHIHSSSLEINNVEQKDSGSYKVFAINSEGSAETTASLLVALKEEQNLNYLSFLKRSEMIHKNIDMLVRQRRQAKLRVDLKHVGSPFDKYAVKGTLGNLHHSRSRLIRTVYISKTPATPIQDDPLFGTSATRRSSRPFGRILDKDNLIDEDIKIKLQLLREAKKKKRFSLALSEASFDLDAPSAEDRMKWNCAYLDRQRSRSMGELGHMEYQQSQSYFYKEQAQSSGEYCQTESPEFKHRMERILGLISQEAEPQRATEESSIEESSRTKEMKSLKERFLSGDLLKETEGKNEREHKLEEQGSDEYYFQKENERFKAVSDQYSGAVISIKKDASTHRPEMVDQPKSAARHTKVNKQIIQCEESVIKCAETLPPSFLSMEKERSTFMKTMKPEALHQPEIEEHLEMVSDQWSGNVTCGQKDLPTKKPENGYTSFDLSKTEESTSDRTFNQKPFSHFEDDHKDYTIILTPCLPKSKEAFFNTPKKDNLVEIDEPSCQLDIEKHHRAAPPELRESSIFVSAFTKQMPAEIKEPAQRYQIEDKHETPPEKRHHSAYSSPSVLRKQRPEVDRTSIGQTKSAPREKELINTSKINKVEAQYEHKVERDVQILTPTPLRKKREVSAFDTKQVHETAVGVTEPLYKCEDKKGQQFPSQQPERIIRTERGFLRNKQDYDHAMVSQSKSLTKEAEFINISKISPEAQHEVKVEDYSQIQRQSHLSALKKETPAEIIEPPLPGSFVSVQRVFPIDKPKVHHDTSFQTISRQQQTDIIGEPEISQRKLQNEYKKLDSTQIVGTFQSPEKKETSNLVRPPTEVKEPPCKLETKEDYETFPDQWSGSFIHVQRDVLKDKPEHAHKISDQFIPAAEQTEMSIVSKSSKRELQEEGRMNEFHQIVRPIPSTMKKETSAFVRTPMKESPVTIKDHSYKAEAIEESTKQKSSRVKQRQLCPPMFVHDLESPEIKQGEMCILDCQFHAQPQPMVTWYKDEQPISRTQCYNIHSTDSKSTLTISNSYKEHEGVYTCVIFNQYGTAQTSGILKLREELLAPFDVHVTDAPEECTGEQDFDLLAEKEVEFFNAPLAVTKSTLQLPGVFVPRSRPTNLSLLSAPVEIKITAPTPTPEQDEERRESYPSDELDSSQDPFSQTTKHKFKFSFDVISEAPKVVKELEPIYCVEGESVMFECLISGEPEPVVVWLQNDRLLLGGKAKYRFVESRGKYRLYIDGVSMSDLGSYKCVANNKAGEALSISSLTIEPAEQSFSKARETQSIYSPRIEPAEQSFNKAREIQSIYSPRIEPAEQSFNKTREIQSIYSPRIEPAEQSFNKTRETQSIYSPRIEPAEQSFICHLKDTEPSDEEYSIVSHFLLNLSKMGQEEGITQQRQLSLQERRRVLSPSHCTQEKVFTPMSEEGAGVTSSSTESSSEMSSLKEKEKNLTTDSKVAAHEVPVKAEDETLSISQYLRFLDREGQDVPEDSKMEEQTEARANKYTFGRESYEECAYSDNVAKHSAESHGAQAKVSKAELSDDSVSNKSITCISVDSADAIPTRNEESGGFSLSEYLLTTGHEEAPVYQDASHETFGYDESGITSMEVEEVTFGAVYDYYNQSEEWTRSLSPESEMSIELGNATADEIENERFYTPPMASENVRTVMSAESFHTPLQSPGFMTPPERLPSPNASAKSPIAALLERFYTPPACFRTSEDEGIETAPLDDLSQTIGGKRSEFFSTPPQEAEAKGNEMPPAFIKPLTKKKIYEGNTLMFMTEVIGCPIPDVKWYKNKSLLEPDHRIRLEREGNLCTLVIDSVHKEDEGEYICHVVNIIGEAKSSGQVDVLSQDARSVALPPLVTHQHVIEFDVRRDKTSRSPSPQEILLEVELDEHEVKEFERQIKIITIPEFTPDNKNMIISLDVLPMMLNDEPNLDFITRENDDVKIDFEVTEIPPRFISHVFDLEIPEKTDAIFECSVTGIPIPEVMWFKDDSRITSDGKKYIIMADNSNHCLKITSVGSSDSGTYKCKTINSVGETTCRGYLAVTNSHMALAKAGDKAIAAMSLGSAQEQPQELDVLIGDSTGHDNQPSEIEVEFEFEQGGDDSQKSLKVVAVTEQEQEGKEKCLNISFDVFAEPAKEETIEFKAEGSETCTFEFQVIETPPKFVKSLLNCSTSLGGSASFQCIVTGAPKPTVTWYMNDKMLQGCGNYLIQEKDPGHHFLVIPFVTKYDVGTYRCKAVNKTGNAVTEAILSVF
ncbi:muscle M-line assembly protein unc-89-like [Callorhinchus milii]|uniref:muscle M-line assembly protein unc-89-like n=1 Tax=Callorhinchus milii TaxID=7868 RepID=UPI001C3FB3D6|nr:muscle M-line assembly protein unc-89-like [Callorhinchus milii]